ncbi:hypothetical protein G6F57_016190 [Rhizopus arrhizus]|nr:hypothetical protein G6F57_016190 [Rhizopus arrhizus]
MPFLHAGSWLIAGALAMAAWHRQPGALATQARVSWKTGRHAVMSVFLFAMMAEVLAGAGISQAYADGLFATLQDWTILITPVLAGAFGILANSGNAPNSLFMPSQLSLAVHAGLNVPAAAALLHVSGTAMGIFSPVRMSIAAGLAHGQGQERSVYVLLLPFALAAFGILLSLALLVVHMGLEQLAAIRALITKQAPEEPTPKKESRPQGGGKGPRSSQGAGKGPRPQGGDKGARPQGGDKGQRPQRAERRETPVDPVVVAISRLQRQFPKAFPKNPAPKLPLKLGVLADLRSRPGVMAAATGPAWWKMRRAWT